MNGVLAEYDHPAWLTMAGAFVGYGLILTLIFLVFFVVPFVLWP